MGGITPMNDNELSVNDVGGSNELKSSNVPMERTFAHLHDMIQIIEKCKQKRARFCDHAISFMKIMALDLWNIHFTKANGWLHLWMMIFHVEDGLGNFIIKIKYWHGRMVMHINVHNKRFHSSPKIETSDLHTNNKK